MAVPTSPSPSASPGTPLSIPLTQSCHLFDHMHPVYAQNTSSTAKLVKQTYYATLDAGRHAVTPRRPFDIPRRGELSVQYVDPTITERSVAVSEAQGKRPSMEDAHLVTSLNVNGQEILFTGVFDGHADGGRAAAYLRDNLPDYLKERLEAEEVLDETTVPDILVEMMVYFDQELQKVVTGGNCGTCALCAIRIGNTIYLPNVGDSRAVLVSETRGYQISEDADPENPRFTKAPDHMEEPVVRLEREGPRGPLRVGGLLSCARELGHIVASPRPKITRIIKDVATTINHGEQTATIGFMEGDHLVIACDGLSEVASADDVVDKVQKMMQREFTLEQISSNLVDAGLRAGSMDNITVMVMRL